MTQTLDSVSLRRLRDRARREVEAGLLPSAQIAVGYRSEVVMFEAFGDANLDTRYSVFSATKAFVAATIWSLIGDGLIDVSLPVAHYIAEFGTNGKETITVEQVMLHTSGFPHAPIDLLDGATSAGRCAAFARWRTTFEPGSTWEYHAGTAHWVLAEIIERVTGSDYRDVVQSRVAHPVGLPRVLGLPADQQDGIATLESVGELASKEEIVATFGRELPVTEVTTDALLRFNDPAVRSVGVPGGGGVMRACDLAVFYQALLHNPGEVWRPEVLADGTGAVRNRLLERTAGYPANRSLGLILAGDDGFSNVRGLGRTVSAGAFGHNGAGGQLAWADPVTGISLGYCTNGLDQHAVREPRRGTAIASLAGTLVSQ